MVTCCCSARGKFWRHTSRICTCYRYADPSNENIITDNCVLGCDWGNTCEIGIETAAPEYKNIVFICFDGLGINPIEKNLDVENILRKIWWT